ncbi:hypothetical protein IW261DRAFT_1470769 [Armillaria novae-zelandiae]|uniref:F-box domain-containing protein n=1 Tax=Armillaria novae-zelandiae TaxID=153914 RepID=A0AA39UJJ6_9AGAR|nr:hypothetical protein IW261DRAFT_1470769 [Armillaria novae-zelandiae]
MEDDHGNAFKIRNFIHCTRIGTRFEIYSRYIRVLDLSNSATDYRPVLGAIAMLRSGAVFLPNLQVLCWVGYENWTALVFIMHNSVTSFYLSFENIPADAHRQAGRYFDFIAARMPHLEHFHFSMDSQVDTSQFSRALELLIPKLTSLKSIYFPPFINAFPIISAASALSHLTDIRIWSFFWNRDATRLFHTALHHLSEIEILSEYDEGPLTVSHLAVAISQCCCNLRKLFLSSAGTAARGNRTPLFTCSAMRQFTIEHAYPLSIHDSDIQTLLTRWPALEHLTLNKSPTSLLARGLSVPLPEWSTLVLFARYGKHLSSLYLYMNGIANILDVGNSCPFTQLEVFGVGNSPTLDTPAEARFLSYILPPGCRIVASRKWKPVVTLVSELRKARGEELERK